MFQKTLVALLCYVATVAAVSSGAVDICNALSTAYGCDFEPDQPRDSCKETNRIMQWCTKPVVNEDLFHLWAGEDEQNPQTTYKPGEWIKVNLRVLKYDMQYRGLLMYAIDAKDEPEGYPKHTRGDPTKLGTWEFTDRQSMFHSHCPRTVLHASGELKPYHTSWRFKAPEDFTGDIQFVGLIKTGPANKGEFWYPNKVVLTKAAEPPTAPGLAWYKGKIGESCSQTCASLEMLCDAPRFGTVDTVDKFRSQILPHVSCNKPPLLRCGDLDLSFGEDGFCYYGNEAQCDAAQIPKFPDGKGNCDSKSDDPQVGGRICPCKCDGEKGPCFVPPPPTTQPPVTAPPTPMPVPGQPANPNPQPNPVACTGAAGGCCKADGTCQDANSQCQLIGATPTCVRKNVCVYGDAGCPCTLEDNACSAQFECVAQPGQQGVCAVKTVSGGGGAAGGADDYCASRVGQAGCWCTPAGGCVEANLVPKQNNDNKCYCAVNVGNDAASMAQICERGDLGCPCLQQRCKAGGVCTRAGSNTLCLEADGFVGSSALALSLSSTLLVALIASLF